MTAHWRSDRERGSPFLLRLMRWLAKSIGRAPARGLLYPITGYFFLTSPGARAASRAFLGRVHGRPATRAEVFWHMHAFAAVILDRVYFMLGQYERFDVRIHAGEDVSLALDSGGTILLGGHVGSFDVARCMALGSRGVPLKVVMQHDHNQVVTRLLEALNPQVADSVIPAGGIDSLLDIHAWLDAGHCVGMLADRPLSSRRTCRCRLFGQHARFPVGPWKIAQRLDVPVILFLGLYRGSNRYDIHLELMGRIPSDLPEQDLCQQWAQRFADRLEYHLRQAPYNWFNFYDFWAEDSPDIDSGRRHGGSSPHDGG